MPADLDSSTRTVSRPAQTAPVLWDGDVIVVGGSPTGVAAGVAASRCGAKTLLVERFGFLGGQMTAGLMLTFHRPFWDKNGDRVVGGLPVELLGRIIQLGGAADGIDMVEHEGAALWGDGWTTTAFDPEATKRALTEMAEHAAVGVLFDTWSTDVVMTGNVVTGVVLDTRTGPAAVLAKATVDATGDAHLAALAGAEFDYRRLHQFLLLFQCIEDYSACIELIVKSPSMIP